MTLSDRYRGALIGLAVGSALGAPYRGQSVGSFEVSEDLVDGPWTAHTSRAIWLAGSLLERREFDSTPGNGSLAWLAPIPMYLIHDGARAKEIATEMSRAAHEETEAVDACRYLTGLMVGALRSESKEALLSDLYSPVYNYWLFQHVALCPAVDRVARGVYKDKQASELPETVTAADTFEAALWAFHGTSDFEEGVLKAVRLGGDTDATAAVYGQLAGAYYGDANIPMHWREKVARRQEIEDLAITVMHETKQGIRHFT